MGLCQGSGQGNEGFSCSCCTGKGDKFYVGIKDCIHRKDLLLVARGDAVGSERLYHQDVAGIVVIAGQDGITVGMTEIVELVARWGLVAEGRQWYPLLLLHQLVEQLRAGPLHVDYPFLVLADALLLDVVREVVLHEHSYSLGLHPQVYVFGNKGYRAVAVVVLVPDGGGQDTMILGIILKGVLEIFREFLVCGYSKGAPFFS